MYAAGVPLERIGDYVGHSGTYMTDRYRHLLVGQAEKDAAQGTTRRVRTTPVAMWYTQRCRQEATAAPTHDFPPRR